MEELHKATENLSQESWYCGNLANTSLKQYSCIIQLDMMVMVMGTVVSDSITKFIVNLNE
jgi:hypothetical protein